MDKTNKIIVGGCVVAYAIITIGTLVLQAKGTKAYIKSLKGEA